MDFLLITANSSGIRRDSDTMHILVECDGRASWSNAVSDNMNKENLEIITNPGSRDGLRILILKGRLTIETVVGLQDALKGENAPELIIDMSGVPSMDSAGLGVMIAAYVRAKKTSRKLAFAGMNERVKAVTDTSRLSQFLDIYPTLKDAETALSTGQ
jgi:anti-anti-sigma factor